MRQKQHNFLLKLFYRPYLTKSLKLFHQPYLTKIRYYRINFLIKSMEFMQNY